MISSSATYEDLCIRMEHCESISFVIRGKIRLENRTNVGMGCSLLPLSMFLQNLTPKKPIDIPSQQLLRFYPYELFFPKSYLCLRQE